MEEGIGELAQGLSQGARTFWPHPRPTFPTPNPQVSTQLHSGHRHTQGLNLEVCMTLNLAQDRMWQMYNHSQGQEEEPFPHCFRSHGPEWRAD